jgi:hypothetical protein
MTDNCGPTHYSGCPCHEARRNRLLEAAEKVVEAARVAHAAAHLRTHGFDGGDISDLDFSKMLPAIVDLDSALSAFDAAKEPPCPSN